MGFNSAFKGLRLEEKCKIILQTEPEPDPQAPAYFFTICGITLQSPRGIETD